MLWCLSRRRNCYPSGAQPNSITLKIKGSGNQYILNPNFSPCPHFLYFNGKRITVDKTDCSTLFIPPDNSINTVKLEWRIKLTNLNGIFANMENLIEIDLSDFDSSLVTDMTNMFAGCSSLISIDLSHLVTT